MKTRSMRSQRPPSLQTRRNWWIDVALFIAAVVVLLSSMYFLYAPTGYQGGRNPAYNADWILARTTWDQLHTWFGIGMILVAAVHFVLHWNWFVMMGKRVWRRAREEKISMSRMAWVNLIVDLAIAIGFFLAAISGIYFLYAPGGRASGAETFIFTSGIWDVIHTWSGIVMFLAFMGHSLIHWRWIVNITNRMLTASLHRKPVLDAKINTGVQPEGV